ncbi:MAG TPA: oxygen-independent coproporphyrinogen III oxidase [bacterium]|nr:oxygen-independent coproporphyrinogen III oxidase [Candidatus Omnitrophota bacterium]HOL95448.1 oxygen-independent coproporphyrinogen III oxidase [bacterium]HPP01477.1 oxygen-independent coproporphyrinogen III oxidase [bacterium]HXK92460.1 oxygen-independent coproporphyrinogen III oxidase [bacterium]
MSTVHYKPEWMTERALVQKYSGRGPRYTSYPTAPEWTDGVGEAEYWRHIQVTNAVEHSRPLSLYIHIPFCEERCSYCACNVIITRRQDVADNYVELVLKEVDLIAPEISKKRRVNQFHLGGGTPTQLSPGSLGRLLDRFADHFTFEETAERSIEVDLRVTNVEHLQVLREHQFNRISMGVQDFSEETQRAINRPQSIDATRAFIHLCREYGFDSINIDLVYGLPFQTADSFKWTLETVYEIDPDRIALYNYAHLPAKIPHQRRIQETWLPDAEERFAIFKEAVEGFTQNGYVYIGLDHFAKPTDELTLAQQEGTLQRNFMGFTTRAGADLYAFGTSSISSLPALYVQNVKKLKTYGDAVTAGRLPIERGMELTRDDRIRRWVIMELMCNLRVSTRRFQEMWGEDFHAYFAEELPRLQPFIADGLVSPDLSTEIRVTSLGQIMVRPVAMIFDAYLNFARKAGRAAPVFSRTL